VSLFQLEDEPEEAKITRTSRESFTLTVRLMFSLMTTPVCGKALDTIDGVGAESNDVKNSSIA
jgi:hypothetical protein